MQCLLLVNKLAYVCRKHKLSANSEEKGQRIAGIKGYSLTDIWNFIFSRKGSIITGVDNQVKEQIWDIKVTEAWYIKYVLQHLYSGTMLNPSQKKQILDLQGRRKKYCEIGGRIPEEHKGYNCDLQEGKKKTLSSVADSLLYWRNLSTSELC